MFNSLGFEFLLKVIFTLYNVPQFLFCQVVTLKLLPEVISAIRNRYVTVTTPTHGLIKVVENSFQLLATR